MGRISVELSDELEKKLRFKTIERFGGRKGDLSRAVQEAVETWVAKEKQKICEKAKCGEPSKKSLIAEAIQMLIFMQDQGNRRQRRIPLTYGTWLDDPFEDQRSTKVYLKYGSEAWFMSGKVILVDDAGWGDLILGVVIGAFKPPDPRYMERRIPVSSFQPPNFENKKYLDDAVEIADEIVEVLQPDMETTFKVCSGYVLSSIRGHLNERGFKVEEVEFAGELQEKVERGYIRWCKEMGVPAERLEDKRRFWAFLDWVAERPGLREKLVKTGWRSWKEKWREKAFLKGSIVC